jgi:CheY-like chemotaxis protein
MHQVKPELRLLVADDEKIIADSLATILNLSGWNATAVYDGRQAVEHARTFRPDILISDVHMPELNGIEASILIRQMLPACKVILVSGHFATAELIEGARLRGNSFEILNKPVAPPVLLARIRELADAGYGSAESASLLPTQLKGALLAL